MSKIKESCRKWFMMVESLRPLIFCQVLQRHLETDCMNLKDAMKLSMSPGQTGMSIAGG